MSDQANCILDAALKLPEAERLVLAQRLLETVSPTLDASFDEEWEAELDRRMAEMDESESAGIPWSTLRQQE